ncbi:MAG: hypothetical protein ACI9AR_000354 [Flavobacteriaceae bacterium]|jgi:hypothetical protein
MKKTVKVLSIIFILIGILGFVKGLVPEGKLLGIFEVDAMHNVIHLLSGIIGLVAARTKCGAKKFAMIFGIIYLIVAIIGFVNGGDIFLTNVNGADNILHLVLAIVLLSLGMCKCSQGGKCSTGMCGAEKCCSDGTCTECDTKQTEGMCCSDDTCPKCVEKQANETCCSDGTCSKCMVLDEEPMSSEESTDSTEERMM